MVSKARGHNGHAGKVGIAPRDARALIGAYSAAAGTLETQGHALDDLTARAVSLLGERAPRISFWEIGAALQRDARDLDWRVTFLEASDGLAITGGIVSSARDRRLWLRSPAYLRTDEEIAELLLTAETIDDVVAIVDWLSTSGALQAGERLSRFEIEPEFRPLVAGAVVAAMETGWRPDSGIEPWLAGGLLAHADPSADLTVELAVAAISSRDRLHDGQRPNPFALDETLGTFGPAAERLADDPPLAQRFIRRLLDVHDRTGDTPLNLHVLGNGARADQLAEVLLVAGTAGPLSDRERFVDRLVRTVNADGNTSFPVLWATWALHAELALEHGVVTTTPTADTHHLLPDSLRPHWQKTWEDRISPAALEFGFKLATTTVDTLTMFSEDEVPTEFQGDPGGTYTTRPLPDFGGVRFHFDSDEVVRGRQAVTHALRVAAPGGGIAQDEFAITHHGIGPNGKPTYTINLPGVIDLSSPIPGFDPVHQSVRDMDQVAIHSAKSARLEDNTYAQMVERALRINGIEPQSNLLIVGHSFGADTALDLAADPEFRESYNLTHVVAAAYDSVPQLTAVPTDVEVLVLQNTDDLAIALEESHRRTAGADAEISLATFVHTTRRFEAGLSSNQGFDAGHHQNHYIGYVNAAEDDTELAQFFEGVAATGYDIAGTSVAVDVSLDESLHPLP